MNWIKVKDKRPDEDGNYLIWQSDRYQSKDGRSYVSSSPILGGFANGEFYEIIHDVHEVVEGVTHWCKVIPPIEQERAKITGELTQKLHRLQVGETLKLSKEEEFAWGLLTQTLLNHEPFNKNSYRMDGRELSITLIQDEND
ncbi:DUF551 domain-containing protein [Parapedobacter soli]|uniref:DUF551 domain-containing protein n=1 Tax=Parapedobacter soli TaxID=416955 RepID=UPI0021C9D2A7|nr:DUF551 domain-containing protein [Parapedobacter soli]